MLEMHLGKYICVIIIYYKIIKQASNYNQNYQIILFPTFIIV